MLHGPEKPDLYAEVLWPDGGLIAAGWLWATGAEHSAAVKAWLSAGPLRSAFITPAEAALAMQVAAFGEVRISDERSQLQSSNPHEVTALEGLATHWLPCWASRRRTAD